VHAASFIQNLEKPKNFIKFNTNPFAVDVLGAKIEFPQSEEEGQKGLKVDESGLLLKPDLTTLRQC